MSVGRIVALMAAGLIASSNVGAQGQAGRECRQQDVIGTWSLVKVQAQQPGVQQFYDQNPNEVMRFGANGTFIYVARRTAYTAAEAKRSLDAADATDGVTYTFQLSGGRLILSRNGSPFEGFRCAIATAVLGQAKRGDLMLSNLEGRPGLLRIQRKLM